MSDNDPTSRLKNQSLRERIPRTTPISRRGLIGAAGLGLTAGIVGGVAAAANAGDRTTTLAIEVACLGPTARLYDAPSFGEQVPGFSSLEESDLRGSPWWVEGWMYPEGTIAGNGFVPTDTDRIGVWFCRGHFLVSPVREDPHLVSSHEYYFDDLAADPIGQNLLVSHGVEGRNRPDWEGERAVTGGTGQYRGARGTVLQREIGRNSTLFPAGDPAPSFRFEFDIELM
jgi:hypothetical protein